MNGIRSCVGTDRPAEAMAGRDEKSAKVST